MQPPENLVVCGLVMIDDSRWLPLGTDKDFLKWILWCWNAVTGFCSGPCCAVLIDVAMTSRMGASIEMDCPILVLCVCVLCMFFSLVGSKQTCQRKFSSDFTRALRKCIFYKLQRLLFKLKTTLGKYQY